MRRIGGLISSSGYSFSSSPTPTPSTRPPIDRFDGAVDFTLAATMAQLPSSVHDTDSHCHLHGDAPPSDHSDLSSADHCDSIDAGHVNAASTSTTTSTPISAAVSAKLRRHSISTTLPLGALTSSWMAGSRRPSFGFPTSAPLTPPEAHHVNGTEGEESDLKGTNTAAEMLYRFHDPLDRTGSSCLMINIPLLLAFE